MAIDFCLCKSRYHFKPLYFVNLSLYKFAQANAPSCTLLPMYLIQNPYFQSPYSLLCRNLKVCLFTKFNTIIITKLTYGLQFWQNKESYRLQYKLGRICNNTFCTWDNWAKLEIPLYPLGIRPQSYNNPTRLWISLFLYCHQYAPSIGTYLCLIKMHNN